MSYDELREQEKKTDRKVEEPAVEPIDFYFRFVLYYSPKVC